MIHTLNPTILLSRWYWNKSKWNLTLSGWQVISKSWENLPSTTMVYTLSIDFMVLYAIDFYSAIRAMRTFILRFLKCKIHSWFDTMVIYNWWLSSLFNTEWPNICKKLSLATKNMQYWRTAFSISMYIPIMMKQSSLLILFLILLNKLLLR